MMVEFLLFWLDFPTLFPSNSCTDFIQAYFGSIIIIKLLLYKIYLFIDNKK